MNLDMCVVTINDLNLSPRYAEKIRGYLGNKYIDKDILHNHNEGKVLYRYPFVQYKIIDNKPKIIGINEGKDIVANIGIKDDELLLDGINYETFQKEIIRVSEIFGCENDYISYKFVTPWIALSQKNINQYREANNMEKEEILKRILIGNIISMSKGLNYTVDKNINCWIDLKEKEVLLKGIKHIAFIGDFKLNFSIPDYLGIGKSVSRGFGTVKRQ